MAIPLSRLHTLTLIRVSPTRLYWLHPLAGACRRWPRASSPRPHTHPRTHTRCGRAKLRESVLSVSSVCARKRLVHHACACLVSRRNRRRRRCQRKLRSSSPPKSDQRVLSGYSEGVQRRAVVHCPHCQNIGEHLTNSYSNIRDFLSHVEAAHFALQSSLARDGCDASAASRDSASCSASRRDDTPSASNPRLEPGGRATWRQVRMPCGGKSAKVLCGEAAESKGGQSKRADAS